MIYLSLGTNMGDRQHNLDRAIDALGEGMVITAVSPIYQTPPWGLTDQPDFLNLCLQATTNLTPHQLLHFNQQVEIQIGRVKEIRWGPRLIDIDILFYDALILQEEQLTIPHPHIAQRAFVLVPLADVAPGLIHPQTGKTVRQMLAAVNRADIAHYSG